MSDKKFPARIKSTPLRLVSNGGFLSISNCSSNNNEACTRLSSLLLTTESVKFSWGSKSSNKIFLSGY